VNGRLAGALTTSAFALVFVEVSAAQSRARAQEASVAIHEARLREVLDLDIDAAVTAYADVATTYRAEQPERWVALTRLAELRRAGIPSATQAPLPTDAPAPVRQALQTLTTPLPIDDMLRGVTSEPGPVSPDIGVLPNRSLWPATPLVQEWARSQLGPSVDDRLRQRLASLRSRRTETSRSSERWYAADILRVELQGRAAQAQALRSLYFAEWRPPAVLTDAGAQLRGAFEQLDAWLAEPDVSSQQASLLRSLRAAIEQRAAESPTAALEFLTRMPIYADRLLRPERR
jgi:hypothetical protein